LWKPLLSDSKELGKSLRENQWYSNEWEAWHSSLAGAGSNVMNSNGLSKTIDPRIPLYSPVS